MTVVPWGLGKEGAEVCLCCTLAPILLQVRRQDYVGAIPYFEAAARVQPREVGWGSVRQAE